jgi:ketosteroid isomerase-like protein
LTKYYYNENDVDRACSMYGDMLNAYTILVVEPRGKRPLRRPWNRWKDNGKMDLKSDICECADWIELD